MTQYEAYRRGEIDHTGVMVHLVPDEAVDACPVVAQDVVPIHPEDSLDQLEERIHAVEYGLLVGAVRQPLSPGT
ncbi:MAG: formyltransferase family protein [Chloroflexota bacterium]|nr:formyltransferase family protein [Chloroflexota bacterium]